MTIALIGSAGRGHGGDAELEFLRPFAILALDIAGHVVGENVFGPLALATAFRSALESARGVVVNLNTVGSLVNFPFAATYSASKAAAHSVTQALRAELSPKGVSVIGVYPGPVDTDMSAGVDMPKATPRQVAGEILDAVESGAEDVFPDDMARDIQRQYGEEPKNLERSIAAMSAAG